MSKKGYKWSKILRIWRSKKIVLLLLFYHHTFFFKFYFVFKRYIIVLVLPNIKMNPPQVYMCSYHHTFFLLWQGRELQFLNILFYNLTFLFICGSSVPLRRLSGSLSLRFLECHKQITWEVSLFTEIFEAGPQPERACYLVLEICILIWYFSLFCFLYSFLSFFYLAVYHPG